MTNTREEVAVAEAIAKYIYHSEGLETMAYAGEEDYARREHHHYLRQASAAIAASNSKYLAGLVEAMKATLSLLEDYIKDYGPTPDEVDIELSIINNAHEALNNLPEELRQ